MFNLKEVLSKYNPKKLPNNPNALTVFRITAVPLIVIFLLYPNRICSFFAAVLFSIAAITDYLDGFYARTRGLESTFGKIMDPIADKLLVCSTIIMLASQGRIPGWIVCIIISREIAVTGIRTFAGKDKDEDISASKLGKYKTGFQIAAIIPLTIHYPFLWLNSHAIGMFFLYAALIFTIWSGIDYFIKYKKFLI